jgi:hypothetical protein
MSKPADLVQGTLEVLILKIVALEAFGVAGGHPVQPQDV